MQTIITQERKTIQDRQPNFRIEGRLFLVHCFNCGHPEVGRANDPFFVAFGKCKYCSWQETKERVSA